MDDFFYIGDEKFSVVDKDLSIIKKYQVATHTQCSAIVSMSNVFNIDIPFRESKVNLISLVNLDIVIPEHEVFMTNTEIDILSFNKYLKTDISKALYIKSHEVHTHPSLGEIKVMPLEERSSLDYLYTVDIVETNNITNNIGELNVLQNEE